MWVNDVLMFCYQKVILWPTSMCDKSSRRIIHGAGVAVSSAVSWGSCIKYEYDYYFRRRREVHFYAPILPVVYFAAQIRPQCKDSGVESKNSLEYQYWRVGYLFYYIFSPRLLLRRSVPAGCGGKYNPFKRILVLSVVFPKFWFIRHYSLR